MKDWQDSLQSKGKRRRFLKFGIAIAVVVLAMLAISTAVQAYSSGISGYSGNPSTNGGASCTDCHSGGVAPTVTLTGPTSVTPGSTNTYTLTISGGQMAGGGMDVSATAGTLASIAGQGTKLQSGEITHSATKSADGSGNVTFNFNWTAPASGSATLYGAGASVNGTGGTSGDNGAKTSLVVTVSTPTTYIITASAGANGSITPSGAVTVNSGASQTFTIAANTGYHVAGVLVDGSSVGAVTSYTFTNVAANHTIAASFAINTYTITASAGANGSITPSGAVTVNSGANQSFSIAANTGYHVAGVLVDGSSAGAVTSYTFTNVTANHTIAASFAINTVGAGDTTGPVTTKVKVSPNHTKEASTLRLRATINDSTTGNSNIAAAEYFIDTVGSNGNGIAMTAASKGSFGSVIKQKVRAMVDVSGLTPGSHTIYVHGRDAAGNWGPTASVTFRVSFYSCDGDDGDDDEGEIEIDD